MPFGLCNAPAKMQRALDILLAQIKWEACLVYLDHVITYGVILKLMLQWLRMIFTLFRSANLRLKPLKCFFGYDKVAYLEHLVSGNGVEVDPEKIRAVKVSKADNEDTGVKLFGLSKLLQTVYRKLCQNCIASPQTNGRDGHLCVGQKVRVSFRKAEDLVD